ncbi:MAG: YlmC/YmxH family sporulation protein [Oscillospiraceae bacterium]
MPSRFCDFKSKELISIHDGTKIGYVDDLVFDDDLATITSIVVYGRLRLFGLLGREDDVLIDWSSIEVIGRDTILVNHKCEVKPKTKSKAGNFFTKLFG